MNDNLRIPKLELRPTGGGFELVRERWGVNEWKLTTEFVKKVTIFSICDMWSTGVK